MKSAGTPLLYLLGFLFLALLSATPAYSACVTNTTLPYRLPRTVIPSHYNLTISPQISQPYELKGTAAITLTVEETTSCIVIHQGELSFSNTNFVMNSVIYSATNVEYDYEHQFAIINFASDLPLGQGVLSIEYSGYLNQNNATGFFVSPLELVATPNTVEEHKKMMMEYDGPTMLATQFEGPYARMAYPCFDEPELKAYFVCTMIVDNAPNIVTLFNTKEVTSTVQGSQLVNTFEQTPIPISTYLVAFAVGTFDYLEQYNNGIRYRIYCSPGKAQYGAFTMNITIDAINYFTNLWDIGYPLNKLDQIAVPRIFQDGMENIGLVTYWPPWLLTVPGNYTVENYQMSTMVVTHEIAHMWFGDTVTMSWWSETYNNEGFARYLQYVVTEHLFPEWNVWEEGGKNSWFNFVYSIIKKDSTGTLPAEVLSESQVSGSVASVKNAFSGPTYPKGGCLNRYFNVYMGDEAWNGALSYHLKKWKYKNPTTYELIYDLDYYTGFSLKLREKFIPWLRLESFPVISLDIIEQGNDSYLTLTQTPVSKYINFYNDAVWFVNLPINVYPSDYQPYYTDTFTTSFSGLDISIPFNNYDDSVIIANEDHTSYLVVRYSNTLWPSVITFFGNPLYDEVLREVFMQDIFILTRMSHTTVNLPLDFTSVVADLESYTLWPTLLTSWFEITTAIQGQSYYYSRFLPILQNGLLNITNYAIELGTATTEHTFQSSVLQWSAYYGVQSSITTAFSLFNDIEYYSLYPPIYLQKYVFSAVGRHGSAEQWNYLYSLRSSDSSSLDHSSLLFGLANTQNTTQCNQLINQYYSSLSLSDQLTQTSTMLFYSYPCQAIAWSHLQNVANQLFSSEGADAANSVLNSFAGAFSSYEYLSKVSNFLQQNSEYLTEQQIKNSLTLTHINIDIVESNLNFPSTNYNTY